MIRLWDLNRATVLSELLQDQGGAGCVALSADGRRLAAGSADGQVRLWEPESGRLIGEWHAHLGGVICLAFGLDGHALATGGRDGAVVLWDLARLKELKRFSSHAGAVSAVAFSPRGDILLTGGEDMTIRIRETVTGNEQGRLRGHAGAVTALAHSPVGRLAASGGWDRSVRIWDLTTGLSKNLSGVGGGVRAIAFSPDGKELFTGGGKIVRTWEPTSGRPLRQFAALPSAVLSSALLADGSTFAVGTADGMIRLLDIATGAERNHLEGHRGPVVSLSSGARGRLLVSASSGASISTRGPPVARQTVAPDVLADSASPSAPIDLDQIWIDLAGGPRQALAALRVLGTDPSMAVELVRERLAPAADAVGAISNGGSPSAEELREIRAVDLLARLGTEEAREVLSALASGRPDAVLTDAAKSALVRIGGAQN